MNTAVGKMAISQYNDEYHPLFAPSSPAFGSELMWEIEDIGVEKSENQYWLYNFLLMVRAVRWYRAYWTLEDGDASLADDLVRSCKRNMSGTKHLGCLASITQHF